MLTSRSLALIAALAVLAPGAALAESTWDDIAESLYGDETLVDDGAVSLEAPYRAEDAALVPITISTALPEGDPRTVRELTLVIDENPSPVAATFTFGERASVSQISTRVRVNAYSPVHAVARLSDGSLHVTEVFVKAAGGCAAPAAKDPSASIAHLGEMKLRRFGFARAPEPDADGTVGPMNRIEAKLMIRHPNNSGLQMDQMSRLYIPAWFVQNVTVKQGEDVILTMEGGISLSEDPSFRFDYLPSGEPLTAEATDTKGETFTEQWPSRPS